eukprot:530118-Rhodomonas_salina.1
MAQPSIIWNWLDGRAGYSHGLVSAPCEGPARAQARLAHQRLAPASDLAHLRQQYCPMHSACSRAAAGSSA